MEVRIPVARGGDGTVHGIGVMNDTGSETMSILSEEERLMEVPTKPKNNGRRGKGSVEKKRKELDAR